MYNHDGAMSECTVLLYKRLDNSINNRILYDPVTAVIWRRVSVDRVTTNDVTCICM